MNADTTVKCAYLFDALKKNGVRSIEMSFSGSGDDGQMEWQNVDYIKEDDGKWDNLTIFNSYGNAGHHPGGGYDPRLTLGQLIEEISEGIINFYGIDYQNYEGNNGSNGSIVFDVETGRISTTYQVYETKEELLYI